MADEAAPQKILKIFSSLLANIKENGDREQIESEPLQSKEQCIEPGCQSITDARNKSLFYDRVQTYSPLTWFAKPLDLSPLVCARYGWKNTDTDMLQCVKCRAFLCGQLPKNVDTSVYRESCEKLKKNLVDSHTQMCTWATNPCPESFMCIPYHDQDDLVSGLCYRVTSLACAVARLPRVTYSSIQAQKLEKEQLTKYLEKVWEQIKSFVSEVVPSQVLLLAAIGWGYSEAQVDVLQCKMCHRKVGLWNYKQEVEEMKSPESSPLAAENDGSDPPVKRQKIEKQNFDPVAEHRYWCPWLQPGSPSIIMKVMQKTGTISRGLSDHTNEVGSQSHEASVDNLSKTSAGKQSLLKREPAWLLVLKLLSHSSEDESEDFCKHMKQSPRLEGLRHLRKVLGDCTSPPKPTAVEILSTHSSLTSPGVSPTKDSPSIKKEQTTPKFSKTSPVSSRIVRTILGSSSHDGKSFTAPIASSTVPTQYKLTPEAVVKTIVSEN